MSDEMANLQQRKRSGSDGSPGQSTNLIASQIQLSQAGQSCQGMQAGGLQAALGCLQHPQQWEAALWNCPTA